MPARTGEQVIARLEFAAAARERAALYGFLAALTSEQPSAAMVQRLRGLPLAPLIEFVAGTAGTEARSAVEAIAAYQAEMNGLDAETAARQLAVDWVRLFRGLRRGTGPVPPYESLYVGDAQGTRVIGEVMAAYRRHGAVPCDGIDDQPDHLGLELGFLAFLAEREAQAWEANEAERATDLSRAAEAFLDAHPRRWAGAYCDAAGREARTSFWRGALLLIKAALRD